MLKCKKDKKSLGGSGVMLPRKIFENLLTVVAVLALFEQFLGKFCFNFLPLNLNVSPNMMPYIFDYACLGRKVYCYQKSLKLWKNCIHLKTWLEMAGGGGGGGSASRLDPPMPAPITMSLITTPTRRFGFSMMRGKFCQRCFELTARTALA